MRRMRREVFAGLIAALTLCMAGCSKSTEAETGITKTPEQAASQMEQAFADADAKTRELAAATSEALRKSEFENAVVSLQTMRASQEITPDQRRAVYNSAVTLEARLISAMESGDKNAERAYQLLKELKRN
jgi:hypothetical protein